MRNENPYHLLILEPPAFWRSKEGIPHVSTTYYQEHHECPYDSPLPLLNFASSFNVRMVLPSAAATNASKSTNEYISDDTIEIAGTRAPAPPAASSYFFAWGAIFCRNKTPSNMVLSTLTCDVISRPSLLTTQSSFAIPAFNTAPSSSPASAAESRTGANDAHV